MGGYDGDLVLPGTADLDGLHDPAQRIIVSCERAKEWLAQALASDDIEQIVELKSQAEAIRVYTMQKQLGHDAELSAAEVVRRAERCIGLAIRKGQAEGRILSTGRHADTGDTSSPKRYAGSGMVRHQHYAMTDGVSPEQFDAALATAKAERNLSRANVVRNLKSGGVPKPVKPILRRTPQRAIEDQIETAIDTLEFHASRIHGLVAQAPQGGDWAKRLRSVRTLLTRAINHLEGE